MKTQNLVKTTALKPGANKQQGSMILESMIAILIFSVGILAIVGLQAASIRNVSSAKYRSDAGLLANQIIGLMWAADKTPGVLQANFNTGGTEYINWAYNVQNALPGGLAPSVVIDGTNTATITISWQSSGGDIVHQHITTASINQ